MKTIVALLCLIPSITFASQVKCSTVETMNIYLQRSQESIVFWGERPVIGPKKKKTVISVVITLNKESGAWTEFVLAPDNVACVVGDGIKGKTITPNNPSIIKS